MRVILFDIDGTLLITKGAGKRALEQAFLELYGIEGGWQGGSFKGMTDRHILVAIIEHHTKVKPDADAVTSLENRYLHHFEREILVAPGYQIMPGVTALLNKLSQSGRYFLGLETGNLEPAAWMKLSRGDLHSHFSFGGFGSDSSDRAEIMRTALRRAEKKLERQIDPSSVLVIGDARQDVLAAKAIGARVAAVLNGTSSHGDFEGLGADLIIETLEDSALERML